jgi:hypothetical protein
MSIVKFPIGHVWRLRELKRFVGWIQKIAKCDVMGLSNCRSYCGPMLVG